VVQDRHPPRVGCVKYLNARPLIRGWPGQVGFNHPATLCAQLARNELDVALVSSFEFLRNPIYRIVDLISISSDGPIYSVFVAHRGKFSEIEEIELDPASTTSVNQLRCLLGELGLNPRLVEGGAPATPWPNIRGLAGARPSNARLLIGDQAIRFRQEHAAKFNFWDLGEQWKQIVDLPFVYALWLIRPEVADAKPIADSLRGLRDKNLAKIGELIGQEKEFDKTFCTRYYRQHLRFTFGETEKQGLRRFQTLCEKHGLLPNREIEFNAV
jgi:predicted solute-binding protein